MSGRRVLKESRNWKGEAKPPAVILTCFTSALKKEAVCSSETMASLHTYQTTELKPNQMPILI
jgi:hypothetical protein